MGRLDRLARKARKVARVTREILVPRYVLVCLNDYCKSKYFITRSVADVLSQYIFRGEKQSIPVYFLLDFRLVIFFSSGRHDIMVYTGE